MTIEQVAARFVADKALIMHWLARLKPHEHKPRRRKLERAALVREYLGAYRYERAARLGVSTKSIWYALRQLGGGYRKKILPIAIALAIQSEQLFAWGAPFFPELPELAPDREGGERNCSGYAGSCWNAPQRTPWAPWDAYLELRRRTARPGPGDGYREFHHWVPIDVRDGSQTIYASGGDLFIREYALEAGRRLSDPS